MPNSERYSYVETGTPSGIASSLPYLPIALQHKSNTISVQGLLDTGSTVNVLPYSIGTQLGAMWEQQTTSVQLTGNLANFEARALIITAIVGNFTPIRLAFAWTQMDKVPLLLGQVNFFMEFDVCFYTSQSAFEVKLKSA